MRGLEYLHPVARQKAEKLVDLCAANCLPVLITSTYRTKDEQNELYAKGRTAPGGIVTKAQYPKSAHNWGVAFDFCRNVKGKEYDNSDGFFNKVGAIAKTIGLTWGGDFTSFPDKPHLQVTEFLPGNTPNALIKKYGTPEEFMKTWGNAATVSDVPDKKPTLRKGNKGEAVEELQVLLKELTFYKGDVDGSFGALTDKAVREYQRSCGLVVDGVVGARTWGRLLGV